MTALAAAVLTGAALLAAAVVLVTSGSWRTALRVLLDLLLAVGLLRLASGRSWTALATAAAIILLRQLLWAGLSAPTTGTAALRVRRSPATVSGNTTNGT
ncbi:hypothetical protein V6U81_27475 [Micromonospora sp. CPCC 205711]|uniref:hypothetical protein n=1 Tax=Micromonospora sp. CPCC 205547 TaxID=3122400 RepID=UPI002FF0D750